MAGVADDRAPTPRVSVVMPVFNGATYLVEALESVLAQSLEELELVVVDDGSQDASGAIIKRFARTDPRVRLLTHERNLGISAALNHGCRLARSPYIARLDSDDIALPGRLSRQAGFLDAHPSVACVGGAIIFIDARGGRLSTQRFPTASRVIHSRLLRSNCFAHPSVMLRRSALDEVGGYRFDQIEDYDLWLRLSERFALANLPEPVILYRLNPRPVSLPGLELQIKRGLAVRAAAQARRASRLDPLAGIAELTPAVIDQLKIADKTVARTLERASLGRAIVLAELGREQEADELLAQATRTLGPRIPRAFAAARELHEAARLLGARRGAAGAAHVLVAFRREPSYVLSRLRAWLSDRTHRHGRPGSI